MTLSATEIVTISNEINNDPLALGYLGKNPSQITNILNRPGTASQSILVVSDTPVIYKGSDIVNRIGVIDGLTSPNNPYGAGVATLLKWVNLTGDDFMGLTKFYLDAGADFNIASSEGRLIIDYLAGVNVPAELTNEQVTVNHLIISETAMNTILGLGMVLMSRARELISRSITEDEVNQVL